jgi:hypothetical protein
LKTNDTRASRPLIFLIVLMSHVAMVVVAIREGRLVLLPKGTHERVPGNAITAPSELPPQSSIDWEHEAEIASQNFLANAEKERNYRDPSGLSAAQLDWIKQNHMKPAPPGIAWQHPRFEFDRKTGLPVFWIDDRCV